MASKPIPPGDSDLERFDAEGLKAEVASLTVYLTHAEAWRIRRVRAFRLLRSKFEVARNEVAALAGVTGGAVKNLIDDLERAEAAYRDGQGCGRCEHPASWHHGRREHPKDRTAGCVPPDDAPIGACFCSELAELVEAET